MSPSRHRPQQLPQASDPAREQAPRPLDVRAQLRQLLSVSSHELITMDRLAELRSFPSAEAARKFVHRHMPALLHPRGRRVLIDLQAFDRACERDAATRKRA